MNLLVERLQEALNDKNISKSELARRSGITRQSLNSYFVGRTRPSQEIISKLANVLGVQSAWLAGYDVSKYKMTSKKEIDIDDDDAILTYEGRRIPQEDIELMKRLLRGKEE